MQKKMIIRKKPMIITVSALCIFMIMIAYKSCGNKKEIKYEYETIKIGNIQKTITASGTLQIYQPCYILSKMNGIIVSVNVGVNANVKKGQVLAKIDSATVDQNLEKTKARFESVSLELQKAAHDFERQKSMYSENLISQQGLENEEFNYKSTYYRYKQVKSDYDQALAEKRNTILVSPIDGIVINVTAQVNSPISTNQEAFRLTPTMKTMNLMIDIDESDIGYVQEKQNVLFTVSAYPDDKFHGTIKLVNINPVLRNGVTTYQSLVVCDNSNLKLRPGMTASATVIVKTKKNVLRVLNQAFIVSPTEKDYGGEGKYVWRKRSSIVKTLPVERVRVETGLVGNMHTEILKNLKKGDEILIKVTQESDE